MGAIDFTKLADAANDDGEFRLSARYWDSRVAFAIDDEEVELLVVNGRILDVGPPGSFGGELARVRVAASGEDWRKVLAPAPEPGWHNFAVAPGVSFTGSVLDRAAYHPAMRRLVALMREQLHGIPEVPEVPDEELEIDDAIGRYIHVDIQGVRYRIYYEETGEGIPLIMQHTAAAHGSQWRHVLADRDYQQNYRLIAYDLPFHGKSLPPTSRPWWAEEYRPTRQWVIDAILGISRALDLDRPVFMGCSIGGLLAPRLAFEHAGTFRAVIGVNAGLRYHFSPAQIEVDTADAAPTIQPSTWFHPRVANDWRGASMLDLMSPSGPPAYQRETGWLYSSSGPPVLAGDSWMYEDLFLEEHEARQIDTSKVDVYLMTSEYDPVALTGAAERLAGCIRGSQHHKIPNAGHFAPSDNPRSFKRALDPILGEIADRSSAAGGR